MQYILVGIGGAFGSIVRYTLGKFISKRFNKAFPIATFIINITGAILLGIISNIGVGNNFYLLLADGFLGAYTTFSTFMYEGFNLFQHNRKLSAFVYILGSLILGIIGFILGFRLSGASFSINDNPFGMVLMIFPLLTFIISLIIQFLIKKKIITLSIVFTGYLIATFTLFNSSFLIWCFIYTGISLVGTFIADLVLKHKKKFTT